MSDAGQPNDAASGAAGSESSGLDLVQAGPYDFVAGAELFVRGRPARCIRFDYPHVYWRFEDEQAARDNAAAANASFAEKHRSYSCTPEIFQVRRDRKREPAHEQEESDTQPQFDDSSDEEDEEAQRAAAERAMRVQQEAQQLQQEQQQDEQQPNESSESSSEASHESSPAADEPVSGARNALLNMFARLPPKILHRDVRDTSEVQLLGAAMSQSLQLEGCARATFRVPNKVTAITLLNCSDVELEFVSCVSMVSLIHCQRCTLRCIGECASYTLDDATECSISFPAHTRQTMFVTTDSAGSVLTAVPAPPPSLAEGEEQPRVISDEVRCVLEERSDDADEQQQQAAEQAADADAAALPVEAAKRQWRTQWSNSDAAFSTTMLVRQGIGGYWN